MVQADLLLNYLVSSCSDDPEESVTFVSAWDRKVWKIWEENNTLLLHLTQWMNTEEKVEKKPKSDGLFLKESTATRGHQILHNRPLLVCRIVWAHRRTSR